jgi:hypothetical protein
MPYIDAMNPTTRHTLRCSIPAGPDQERRVASLKDWAEFLAKSVNVNFSIAVSYDSTICNLIYIADESPRLLATKLKIATGEDFRSLPTGQVVTETDRNAAAQLPMSAEANNVDRCAPVSLMITRAQRRDLRKLGYSAKDIGSMTPAEAHRILGLPDKAVP